MYTILLALHVIAAVLFLGPVTYAVSRFQVEAVAAHKGDERAAGTARTLHKVTSTYGVLSLLAPLLGIAVMFTDPGTYWTDGRFHASIGLSVVAWALLIFLIIPRQKKMAGALGLLGPDEVDADEKFRVSNWDKAKGQLSMFGGIFALLWVVIAVLMVI
ncbi:membrane protein [Corynebacterium frankenforstense DSM 45800]|uniref:Membrane protein n=1 Tax=Corynebacterium frankenforstense DSM 45800 TaxID=1437875 RepID=A0A1L7CS79_9CORY|nr:DUF2269 domain-containing protein [Corynebacterium frankenforstense]APT88661.1 membrane protein [Corynebacterium frankenforstense DSM 45800]